LKRPDDCLHSRRHAEALLRALYVAMDGVFADAEDLANRPITLP
jgi:hypothetical protein